MKRSLNTTVANSDPAVYDPNIAAYQYTYETPVHNGAKYLDATYPGWARRVDLQTFNMAYTSADILAQVHGKDMHDTPEYETWSRRAMIAHGILCAIDERHAYDSLTIVWLYEIKARRNERAT